jgi:uncharacterized membrane protein
MTKRPIRPRDQFIGVLLLASAASILLFLIGAWREHSFGDAYLITNLILAGLPLIFAGWLVRVLRRKLWSSWEGLLASFLWLVFLPNSFYMVSDFIHLQEVSSKNLLFDAVMFTSFIFIAFIYGLSSLYLVHQQFRKRFTWKETNVWLMVIFLLCSFAIYLGRDLRWNSWNVLTNPTGLLFDISDRILHPDAYPDMFLTTGIFFVLISTMYMLAYKTIQLVRTVDI